MDQRGIEAASQSGFMNDDLDKKLPRARLDMEHIQKEVDEALAQLGAVEHLLQVARAGGQSALDGFLRKALNGFGTVEELREVLSRAASGGVIENILTRCQNARTNLEAYLQRRRNELAFGGVAPDLKGRIRQLRSEAARYRTSADTAQERLNREGTAMAGATRDQLVRDQLGYGERQRMLMGLESQLVSSEDYQAVSESAFLTSILLDALTGGRHGH